MCESFDDLDLDRDVDESFAVVVHLGPYHEVRNITRGSLGRGGELEDARRLISRD